uniref:DUF4886 domain-containing protein n=1 Tax=Acetatifactor sp. TaxID=1872090 RepID=UPI0040572A3C
MVKILAIGNSFSEDATYYLHRIAEAAGIETKVVNLYIGGCPLERHWQNVESGGQAYVYQLNGVITDRYVSIQEALAEEEWDYIVTQQASPDSGWAVSYEPFLGLLIDYIKRQVPGAEILLQETWAYEIDSTHSNFMRYHRDQSEMYEKLRECYYEAAKRYGLRLLPCGDVIQKLRGKEPFVVQQGGQTLCRDGFHMHHIYGRYTLACVWAKKILGVILQDNAYTPHSHFTPEEVADESMLEVIREVVDKLV